jgi:hypothetical protein
VLAGDLGHELAGEAREGGRELLAALGRPVAEQRGEPRAAVPSEPPMRRKSVAPEVATPRSV